MSDKYIVLIILSAIAIPLHARYLYLIRLACKSDNVWEHAKEGVSIFVISMFLDVLLLCVLMSK